MLKKMLRAIALMMLIQGCYAVELEASNSVECTSQERNSSFSFLSQKYPDLVREAEKDFKSYPGAETPNYSSSKYTKEYFLESAKTILKISPIDSECVIEALSIQPHQYPAFLMNRSALLKPFLTQLPDVGFFTMIKKRKMIPQNIFEDIVLAGEFIYQHLCQQNNKKNLVLTLGRTPDLVHLVYQTILEIMVCENQHAEHVNFSGSPDNDTTRDAEFYRSQPNILRTRNLVTPEKLAHFFAYLDTKNLLNYETIHILDMIGKGSGLNSFLRVLKSYFEAKNVPFPKIEFLCLTADLSTVGLNKDRAFQYESQGAGQGVIHFKYNPSLNYNAFDVATTLIHIDDLTLTQMLHNNYRQEFGSFGIEYCAQKWTPKYDEQRATGGKYSSELSAFVRHNSALYINAHMKKQGNGKAKP